MLGVAHQELMACDRKPSAKQVLLANTSPRHFFEDVNLLKGKAAPCAIHDCECNIFAEPMCQLLLCGPPCTPFSQQRATRHSVRSTHALHHSRLHHQACALSVTPSRLNLFSSRLRPRAKPAGSDGEGCAGRNNHWKK